MSVHYSPQQQVLRNISVGKTPITVNVSSVDHGGDYTIHNGPTSLQYPVIGDSANQSRDAQRTTHEEIITEKAKVNVTDSPPPPGYYKCPHCHCSCPQTPSEPLYRTEMTQESHRMYGVQERSVDLSIGSEEDKYKMELEGIVHQIFANMALQHQTPHMRKLTGNHIVLPREDLVTVVAYTVGCSPSEVRINQGFHEVGCFAKNDGVSLVDSIKIGIKDLYLAYNDKYNLLEDVYHISLHYCFDLDSKGKPIRRTTITYG